ncbi:MAG TPA: hypothetical protein VG754_12755, partial [Verrucomicrobiae bacterium]|nr:hypothetical protein [Verrucomicrobiae bacterium]
MKTFLAFCCALFYTACVHAAGTSDGSVTLRDFHLVGDLHDDRAAFTLTATAHVEDSHGGSLDLLSGTVALTEIGQHSKWHVRVEQNRFALTFDRGGDFPIKIKFTAAVRLNDGWNTVDFRVAPSALQPIVLEGLAADTQFQFAGAARPEHVGNDFTSYLPADGSVKLAWKEARREAEGKLFYAAESLAQITVRPGLMRQTALLDFKVMQGELSQVALVLRGDGEVTRVQGDQVLAWNVEPAQNGERRLVVRLNQPQKDQFALQVQMQTPLGAFPQVADAMQLRPDGATRYAGWIRVVNEGAVRLEVTQASGLSQISPEQFPESDATKALFAASGSQRFAYRFSGADFALRIQADQIFPELSVSQVTSYNLGENELAIDSEIELDVREAPLRELLLHVPKGYAIARLTASGLTDYFLTEPQDQTDAELRLVYAEPLSGRQLIELRLERNQALGAASWMLPHIEVAKAKSVRGHIAVSADAGFRLTPERTQSLVEIATAFFPKKIAGIQTAFRLNDASWEATLHVERLPQTVQADVLHLFSIGEGIAYGSSVMNYTVSGAPMSAFRVQLSEEYFNVEFTGKDVRNWQKTSDGYLVQLHTPVSGAYTLLATYERPFKSQGETLAFTGARPVDAQNEQGHTLVISAYQFQVKPAEISPGLLSLETGEVPPEYRLLFDAPILAAYRYTSRPFNLRLTLTPRIQHDSLSQVVDRATLTTRISKEGQVLTDARYFLKNRGNPNFRFTLPEGSTNLWSATVNGTPVVPVLDGKANLIPLPQRADPNAVLTVELKLAARSKDPGRVTVAAPTLLDAPILLGEWRLEPDTGQRLVYRKGSLAPVNGVPDISGFAGLARVFSGQEPGHAIQLLVAVILLTGIAIGLWHWTLRNRFGRFSARHLLGTGVGLLAFGMAMLALYNLGSLVPHDDRVAPADATFLAPVQQAGSSLSIEVANVPLKASALGAVAPAWPALLALLVWFYGGTRNSAGTKTMCGVLGWTLLAWAALRIPNGAPVFCLVLIVFLLVRVAIPAMRRLLQLPRQASPDAAGAPAIAAFLLGALLWLSFGQTVSARPKEYVPAQKESPLAESVIQQIRVEDKFAIATAKIHWQAEKGQRLPVLFEPAVLTHIIYPTRALKLEEVVSNGHRAQELVAHENGAFDIEVQYELQVSKTGDGSSFILPTQNGLINQIKLTLANLDVDVASPQAVSIQRDTAGSNTVATLVLSPLGESQIGWRPRSRDVKREKPVF